MERRRIMNSGSNVSLLQILPQSISAAASDPYDIEMVDMRASFGYRRWHDSRNVGQEFGIHLSMLTTQLIPLVKMLEFHQKNSSLKGIEAAVVANQIMLVLLNPAVVSQ